MRSSFARTAVSSFAKTARSGFARRAAALAAGVLLAASAGGGASRAQGQLPNPVLVFMGQEYFTSGGKQWTRYNYVVFNRSAYPDSLFAASPDLPPCGSNAKAARTWVDIYAQDGKRLYGFCALGRSDDLGKLWFAMESSALPPSWVYIEMKDRKTNTTYKSNLADTTM